MTIAKTVTAQRDFSAGQLDPWVKRNDDVPIHKSGARQLVNWRILNSRSVNNRPGRRVLFFDGPRTEEVAMSPDNNFYIVFGHNYLRIYNVAGTKVFDTGLTMPWTAETFGEPVWQVYQFSIYVTYAGMRPQVLTWDGLGQSGAWTLAPYNELVLTGGQKRTIFYRISPLNITMLPSARTGNINVTFSAGMNLTPSHVGTRMRFVNRQILITGVTGPTTGTATVIETLYAGFALQSGTGADMAQYFEIGDEVIGQLSGARGIVTGYDGVGNVSLLVQGISTTAFGAVGDEVVVGNNGSVGITIVVGGLAPRAISVWDDEVMNDYRGYPASCFVDQGRLGFCDFPAAPNIIGWSAVGAFTDLYTDSANAQPNNAIVEIVPSKSRVLYVVPGMESAEFVFCNNAVYYIPITVTNPLKPGSVSFNQLTSDGAAKVQPRAAEQMIVYVGGGGTRIQGIQAPGAYNRPYIVDDISSLHSLLIRTPISIAVQNDSTQFEEQYIHVLNSDGTIAVGKYKLKNGVIDGEVGWAPWVGIGTPTWISAFALAVIYSSAYAPNGIAPVSLVEVLDNSLYLDAVVYVNNIPAALQPAFGQGPLWWLSNGTVDLIDNGTRNMGTYQIDGQGYIVPQNNGGENLASLDLVAGQPWTATLEPFIPAPQAGQDVKQRMLKRRVARAIAYVENSTGFLWARLFSGPLRPNGPALGTIMNYFRVPTWNQGDDPTLPPPLREQAYPYRTVGRDYDPRIAIIKDTPGPITVVEVSTEVSL